MKRFIMSMYLSCSLLSFSAERINFEDYVTSIQIWGGIIAAILFVSLLAFIFISSKRWKNLEEGLKNISDGTDRRIVEYKDIIKDFKKDAVEESKKDTIISAAKQMTDCIKETSVSIASQLIESKKETSTSFAKHLAEAVKEAEKNIEENIVKEIQNIKNELENLAYLSNMNFKIINIGMLKLPEDKVKLFEEIISEIDEQENLSKKGKNDLKSKIYMNLGNAYDDLKKYEEGSEIYEKTVRMNPDNEFAQDKLKRYKQALEISQENRKIIPYAHLENFDLDPTYSELKRYGESIEACRESSGSNPFAEFGESNLGFNYGGLKKYEQGIEAFTELENSNLGTIYGSLKAYEKIDEEEIETSEMPWLDEEVTEELMSSCEAEEESAG